MSFTLNELDQGEVPIDNVPDDTSEQSDSQSDDWDEISKGRYFGNEEEGPLCHNCKSTGHKAKNCPHQLCRACGALDDHDTIRCPMTRRCYNCSRLGHSAFKCPEPQRKQGSFCRECGSQTHLDASCPQIWRLYLPNPEFDPNGSWDVAVYCYNCAERGHYGDDCPLPHRSRQLDQSAFCMANQPESKHDRLLRREHDERMRARERELDERERKEDWFARQRKERRFDPYARPVSRPIVTSERYPRGVPSKSRHVPVPAAQRLQNQSRGRGRGRR